MSKIDELTKQIEQMAALLAQHGLTMPNIVDQGKRAADYMEFGSQDHEAFLGLVRVDPKDTTEYIKHTGKNGITYRLEDEVTQFMNCPDPKQVAALVLRQKINELEAGPPHVFAGAPDLWWPVNYGGM